MKKLTTWIGTAGLVTGILLQPGPSSARAEGTLDLVRQLNQAFIDVAEKVSPSVVVITVAHKPDYDPSEDQDNPLWEWLPPQLRKQFEDRLKRRQQRKQDPVFDGQGSGVVIRADGYILTNRHVVDGADKIHVRFKDGKEYDAEIRGVDAQSDVAVVKIEAKGLTAARLADSAKTRVGEFAIAIGAPFDLDYSVTFGHVSAKGRSRIIPDPSMDQDFIQTDANINPGNSGGPLVNIEGEVIGINTLIRGLHTGIGFAIPSNLAREVADRLISDGKFTRAWLGLEIRALTEYPEYKDMVKGVTEGVVVTGMRKDGPAAKSELKLRDVITAVDGRPVASAQQLRNEVRSKKIGHAVNLDVVRDGKHVTVKVKTEEWPDEAQVASTKGSLAPEAEATDLGVTVKPLTKDLAKEYEVEMTDGLLVTDVDAGGVAERRGLRKGDIITEVNQVPVTNLKEYKTALKRADTKKGVIINLISQGVSKFVVLKDAGD